MMRKILGPPGTGKTTRLLHYARTFLKLGTPIDKIGYFAFTKKAATEIRDWLEGNICRCTGYQGIVAAVKDAASKM